MHAQDLIRLLQQTAGAGELSLQQDKLYSLLTGTGVPIRAGDTAVDADLGIRLYHTREFGMILSAGPGGADADLYRQGLRRGQGVISAAATLTDGPGFMQLFRQTLIWKRIARRTHEDKTPNIAAALTTCFNLMTDLANLCTATVAEIRFILEELSLELHISDDGEMMAVNGACRLQAAPTPGSPRPVHKIDRLLHPRSIGIIGVSATKMNFGRIILKNILTRGYDKSRLTVIKPGDEEIDGVKCVESLAALDHKLDLFVVAVNAEAVFQLVDEIIETNAAESVMLIPGGLGETAASREATQAMMEKIALAHRTDDGGPVFLGGNCLGVVSNPGNYDTWFIPREKLPRLPKQQQRNSVLLSQSGAFMVTRLSQNPWLDPDYMIALGNQNDLTHGDMLGYFVDKAGIDVIGVYVEGFRERDGLAFAAGIRKAVLNGKQVIVYKAGHTDPGQTAARSHTASIAGDYPLFTAVISEAGAMIAASISEFNDLMYTAICLHHKQTGGNRLAAVSGAGFETVGMADSIEHDDCTLQMAVIGEPTRQRLAEILIAKKLDALMEVRNPFDINPGADDEAHTLCTEAFARDPNVDAVVVGLDPLSPMMRTLVQSARPGFDIDNEASIVQLLAKLVADLDKPVIGIIDGGSLYDPMAEKMMDQGVCIFRSCDRGIHALAKYTEARLKAETLRKQAAQGA